MLKKYLLMMWLCSMTTLAMAFNLNDLQQQLQRPKNIKGVFVQQRYLGTMKQPIVSHGSFVLVPNTGLLWQLQKPFSDTMRIRKSGIEQLNPQGKWSSNMQSASAQKNQIKLFLDLLAGHTDGLQSQFNLMLSGDAGQWQLRLVPKSVLMKQIFTRIDIGGGAAVNKISLYEKQGDHTDIIFSEIKTNMALNEFEQTAILP